MRTLADLDYDRTLGVDSEPPFHAQGLVQASTPLVRGVRWYAFRNDAWPDSDLDAPYLLGSITLELDLEDGYYAEVAFLAARGSDTLGRARRRIRRMSVRRWREEGLTGAFLRENADVAARHQAAADASYRRCREHTPWLFPGHTDHDFDGALWARELGGTGEPFPVSVVDMGASSAMPSTVDAIDDGRTWAIHTLPDELRGSRQPAPVLPSHPVRVEATACVFDSDIGAVAEQIRCGTRTFECTLQIGTRADICGLDAREPPGPLAQ